MYDIHLSKGVKNLESEIDELLLSLINKLAERVRASNLLRDEVWLVCISVIDELLSW